MCQLLCIVLDKKKRGKKIWENCFSSSVLFTELNSIFFQIIICNFSTRRSRRCFTLKRNVQYDQVLIAFILHSGVFKNQEFHIRLNIETYIVHVAASKDVYSFLLLNTLNCLIISMKCA